MEVRGYEPTLHDEKQLVRAMAHEKSQASVDRDRTPPLDTPGSASNAGIEELGPEQKRSGRRGSQVGELPVLDDRLYSGELLAHGQEHYKRDPREEMSYYVQVDGPDGMVELWGKDLQRALEQSKSGVRVGDRVVVRQTGQQGVTVWAREFDDAGNVVGKREKDTHRNAWSVEKEDFATDRAELARIVLDRNVPAERGAREHPQLVGTYFALKHAELFAKNLLETKEHQQQFVDALRERIAQSIERGDPLPMTKIRDRRPERARETADREPPMRRGPDPVLV
jgi:putative DNA primase/helicase